VKTGSAAATQKPLSAREEAPKIELIIVRRQLSFLTTVGQFARDVGESFQSRRIDCDCVHVTRPKGNHTNRSRKSTEESDSFVSASCQGRELSRYLHALHLQGETPTLKDIQLPGFHELRLRTRERAPKARPALQ
jgi:hypothetical protein